MTQLEQRMEVKLSKDRMTAELKVGAEGELPSEPELRAFLASRQILFGLKDEGLRQALTQRGDWIVVAVGTPPKPPVHGRIQPHIAMNKPKPRIEVQSDDSVNLKELGILENVTTGMILASLVDPEPGSAGRDVTGQILSPEPARAGVLAPGRNTVVSENGRELVASMDGRVILESDGRLSVDNVFTVNGDVGPATGNINFLGSVMITGNICADYRVRAAEKIVVIGAVEGAVLEAGQEITVKGGVFGADKAILQTSGVIRVKSAQDCRILCGGTLFVADSLLRVHASAAQAIILERGAIVGGTVTSPKIEAATIGAESETRTLVEIGIAPRAKLNGERLQTEFVAARALYIRHRTRLLPLVAAQNAGKILSADDLATMHRLEQECDDLEKRLLIAAGETHSLMADASSAVDGCLHVEHLRPGAVLASLHMERPVQKESRRVTVQAHEGKLSGGADAGGAAGTGLGAGGERENASKQ